jgi:hypothetical protein
MRLRLRRGGISAKHNPSNMAHCWRRKAKQPVAWDCWRHDMHAAGSNLQRIYHTSYIYIYILKKKLKLLSVWLYKSTVKRWAVLLFFLFFFRFFFHFFIIFFPFFLSSSFSFFFFLFIFFPFFSVFIFYLFLFLFFFCFLLPLWFFFLFSLCIFLLMNFFCLI